MRIYYLLVFLMPLLIAPNSGKAQISAGLDSELQHTLDSMKTVLGAKSLSAAIQVSDGSVWAHAVGTSSVSEDVTSNDAYLIGSVAKTITSACILQLADEGTLNLDDSLYEWLPTMPYIDTTITIRQLLNHTSGLYDVLSHPHHQDSLLADMSRIWTPEELIDRFISPPIFQPGASWSYCNTNYFLLGMIIQEATGNPFYTELRNRFYDPLGLSTFFIPAFETVTAPIAHAWLDITGDGILDDAHNFYMSYLSLNSTAGAAGGYFSTPTDCTKWMRKYMRGDLLSPSVMAEAKTTITVGGNIQQYGLGLMHKTSGFLGYEAYGHGGDLVYHASSWYFPEFDQSITVFTNDNTKNSWTLLPVVRELLRTYVNNQTASLEENQISNISVGPIPFTDQITISWDNTDSDAVTLELEDSFGRKIDPTVILVQNEYHFQAQIKDLERLPAGVYFVKITGENGRTNTLKILK
ncbi:serine hydrolase [uncultured Fluviicola sp.]|uniref:serine hydrolase n=1 Tax=uncultured Fluviicola sp. TaxID=463303 RepID=UPI0025EE0A8A|nr:serine hydrolase [uncultured Fluviicola sp.]